MKIPNIKNSKSIEVLQALAIIDVVNSYYKLDCTTDTRKRRIAFPRQVAMYFIHRYANLSQAQNASLFNRDHATVQHARKTVNSFMELDLKCYREVQHDINKMDSLVEQTKSIVSKDHQIYSKRADISKRIYEMKIEDLMILENHLIAG